VSGNHITERQIYMKLRENFTQEVRTDSLSAAYKNSRSVEDFTASYKELIAHYGFIATRNNTGVAHEYSWLFMVNIRFLMLVY
jgi:hypothetical protein